MCLDQYKYHPLRRTPDMSDDLVESTDIIGIGRQQVEQTTFGGGQAYVLTVHRDFMTDRINPKRSDRNNR